MTQLFIALFGLSSIWMAMGENTRLRKWAPIVGLCGQPFWAWFAYETGAWGLGVLVAAFTVVYARGMAVQWSRRLEEVDLAQQLAEMTARKDAAYEERNKVVAALAKVFPSGVARTGIEGWSEDWHGCVYIDLPTGQVSWHFHDSQAHLFAGLPPYTKPWDSHNTPEKYRRLAELGRGKCDGKDPRGCWNVRCQLGRTCRRADGAHECPHMVGCEDAA